MITIAIDAMGGDNAPDAIINGAFQSLEDGNIKIILVGDTELLKNACKRLGIPETTFEIVQADEVITMEDEPVSAVRKKKNSSIAVGMGLVNSGAAAAFVSAGSTGAVLASATLLVGRIKGVKRPALAPVIPTVAGKTMLLDCGANAECKPEYILQFAEMGAAYYSKMFGKEEPVIKLLNIGAEEHKGTEVHKEAYKLLRQSSLNFCGNVEGNEFMFGACDVAVADGFSGNIMLKSSEGMAKAVIGEIKSIFTSSSISKLSALLILKKFKALKKRMSASEIGGVPLLGISKPIVKAHGNSDAHAFCNAILQAKKYAESGIIEHLERVFSE